MILGMASSIVTTKGADWVDNNFDYLATATKNYINNQGKTVTLGSNGGNIISDFSNEFKKVKANNVSSVKDIEVDSSANVINGSGDVIEGIGNADKLLNDLKEAGINERINPMTGIEEPYMKMLESDDYKLLLRRDIGDFSHGDLNHWNLEIQSKAGKVKFDRHIYVDDNGNITKIVDWIPQKKGKNISKVIFDITK